MMSFRGTVGIFSSGADGNAIEKVLPSFNILVAQILPPIILTKRLVMLSPIPVPSSLENSDNFLTQVIWVLFR